MSDYKEIKKSIENSTLSEDEKFDLVSILCVNSGYHTPAFEKFIFDEFKKYEKFLDKITKQKLRTLKKNNF